MACGDHICVKRLGGLYTHHGIDLGDGTVVHLSGEPLRRKEAKVCRVSLEEFLKDGALEMVEHGPQSRSPELIVKSALACLGDSGYDVWRNNCEHFASFCATGRKDSHQVTFAKRVAKLAAGAAAAVVIVTGAVAMSTRRGRSRNETPNS